MLVPSRSIAVVALVASLCGCPGNGGSHEPKASAARPVSDAQPATSARVELLPEGHPAVSVRVEIARSEEEVRQGLMFRMQLDEEAGMLFLFDRPQQLSFWMRNTFIPLDMIFIKPDMTVLGVVENAEPRTDTRRMVPGESQYVLEVNAGFSRRHGITAGARIRFEGVTLPSQEGATR
jgi:uncharacterized protein